MYVVVELIIDSEASPTWKRFFEKHDHVSHLEWRGDRTRTHDVTVFFKDSDEPFPLTSLTKESSVKVDIKDVLAIN